MKIDFTQFENPVNALTLSGWDRSLDLDISPEAAALAGVDLTQLGNEYLHGSASVDFRVSPDHTLVFDAASLVADQRANGSLRSVSIQSDACDAAQVCELAEPIIQDWKLHCFEEGDEQVNDDVVAAKLDAVAELANWRANPQAALPSYVAQTDSNPAAGLWLLRLVINPSEDSKDLFQISIQVFWRDSEFDRREQDEAFWARANAMIGLANEQATMERIPRVAQSFLYAAARFSAFDYWNLFDDAASFKNSKEQAIQQCVDQFKEMLIENFDDHEGQFENG